MGGGGGNQLVHGLAEGIKGKPLVNPFPTRCPHAVFQVGFLRRDEEQI